MMESSKVDEQIKKTIIEFILSRHPPWWFEDDSDDSDTEDDEFVDTDPDDSDTENNSDNEE